MALLCNSQAAFIIYQPSIICYLPTYHLSSIYRLSIYLSICIIYLSVCLCHLFCMYYGYMCMYISTSTYYLSIPSVMYYVSSVSDTHPSAYLFRYLSIFPPSLRLKGTMMF